MFIICLSYCVKFEQIKLKEDQKNLSYEKPFKLFYKYINQNCCI